VNQTSAEDLERLASRLALLVGDDGEAEAAGRAVGLLARKLGLSGGHLKTIFLAGAGRLNVVAQQAVDQTARAERLEGEASSLQHSLEQLDYALTQAQRQRDALRVEVEELREALDRARTGRQVQLTLGIILVLAALGAGAVALYGPRWLPHSSAVPGQAGLAQGALVRSTGAAVHVNPDAASPVIGNLPPNTRVSVQRLVWNDFVQWAELRLGARTGYAPVTDLDLD
jgi:hypothetical protein